MQASPIGDPVPRHGFRGDAKRPRFPQTLTIAVSRQAGARGGTVARHIGQRLGWQVIDQDLAEYMVRQGSPERGLTPAARDWIDARIADLQARGTLGREYFDVARVILALGATGEVIIVGRGAGHILPPEATLHVRFIAPRVDRVAYFTQWLRLTPAEAEAQVNMRDERRTQFLLEHLSIDPMDPVSYDLILNTSRLGEEQCAELVARAARGKWVDAGPDDSSFA